MPTIRDHNVGWLRKEVYYPVQTSEAITIGTTAGSSQLQSQESTSSILALITGTKLVGLSVTGSGVDGTDWMEKIPFDVDLRFPIGIRPVYTKDATGASHTTVFTWTAKYSQIASKLSRVTYLNAGSTAIGPGSTILTASSALTTVIASSDTQAAATDSLQVYVGNQGLVNGSSFTSNAFFWTWQMLLTTAASPTGGTTNLDKMWLLGIVLDYMPHLTVGQGNLRNRGLRSASTPMAEGYSQNQTGGAG